MSSGELERIELFVLNIKIQGEAKMWTSDSGQGPFESTQQVAVQSHSIARLKRTDS